MARQSDPTPAIINRVLKAAFPAHNPSARLTRRSSKGGYNLSLAYSAKDGLPALTSESVYAALAQRLSLIRDGHSVKPTLAEVKAQFAVKSIIGIGPAYVVGERPEVPPNTSAPAGSGATATIASSSFSMSPRTVKPTRSPRPCTPMRCSCLPRLPGWRCRRNSRESY